MTSKIKVSEGIKKGTYTVSKELGKGKNHDIQSIKFSLKELLKLSDLISKIK